VQLYRFPEFIDESHIHADQVIANDCHLLMTVRQKEGARIQIVVHTLTALNRAK
jgi:hypothetical protein